MDLIDDRVHRTLEYVALSNRAGARLTLADLRAFSNQPVPRPAQTSNFAIEVVQATQRALSYTSAPAERVEEFVTRVRWVVDEPGAGVKLTRLGRAVLDHANRPPLPDDLDEPLTVTIDPDDPFAYTKVLGLIAEQGEGMLIDPYLTLDALQDIVNASSTTRILTTDRDTRRRLSLIAHGLGVVEDGPEIRKVAASTLHDRFFIADDGPVYVLGSSLNSITRRPGVITPITDEAGAGAIRTAYESIWANGTRVEPLSPPTPESTSGGSQPTASDGPRESVITADTDALT